VGIADGLAPVVGESPLLDAAPIESGPVPDDLGVGRGGKKNQQEKGGQVPDHVVLSFSRALEDFGVDELAAGHDHGDGLVPSVLTA
jgi:hypothetical protein